MNEIRDAITKMMDRGESPSVFIGVVEAVDESLRTADVSPIDGSAPVPDVRLQPAEAGNAGAVFVPVVGAQVIVIMITPALGYIAHAGALEKVHLVADRVNLSGLDGEPLPLGNSLNDSLSNLIDQVGALVDIVTQFATTQNAAAVGPLAPLQAGYISLNAALSSITTGLNTVKSALKNHLSAKTFSE